MTIRTALARALWIGGLAVLLGGCSSLPFFKEIANRLAERFEDALGGTDRIVLLV